MKRCKGNLRPAPAYITPELVGRILAQADETKVVASAGTAPHWIPVVELPPAKRKFTVVEEINSPPPPSEAAESIELRLLRIAHARGLAIFEVIRAVDRNKRTIKRLAAKFGLVFGSRPLLIEPLTVEQLLRLADVSVPLPGRQFAQANTASKRGAARRVSNRTKPEPERLKIRSRAVRIAFDRGIAIHDVAIALGEPGGTTTACATRLKLAFGRRPILAEPISLADLLALADPNVPIPALRSDVLRPIRQAKAIEDQRYRRSLEQAKNPKPARTPPPTARARSTPPSSPAWTAPETAERHPCADRPRPALQSRTARAATAIEDGLDRERFDRASQSRVNAVRRGIMARAEKLVDSGKAATKATNVHVKIAVRAVEAKRAEDARLACPIEQAKSLLQRRRVVFSMAVHGGDPNLFFVSGLGSNVTKEQLIAAAERDQERMAR